MTYSEAKEHLSFWRRQVRYGGDTDRQMIHKIVRLEARVRELEAQIAGLLPAAQVLVTSIEFIPIPASNAAADSALSTGTGETSGGNAGEPVKSAMLP